MRHGLNREVFPAQHAVTAGPDLWQRGAAFFVDDDPAGLQGDQAECIRFESLADGFENLVSCDDAVSPVATRRPSTTWV